MNIKTIVFGFVLSVLFTSVVSAEGKVESIVENNAEISTNPKAVRVAPASNLESIDEKSDQKPDSQVSTDSALTTTSLLASLKDTKPVIRPAVSDGAIGKMFFGLVGVLILIFSCSWVLKRFNINKFGMTSSLSVSGVLPIGAKEKVIVVDIEGTRLVLGVTATNITKLHTLEAVDDASPPNNEVEKPTISSDFSEKMKKIMKEGLKSD